MIPEEYYKATHLRQRVEEPCLVDSKSEFCVDYRYLALPSEAVNVAAVRAQLAGTPAALPLAPFESFQALSTLVTCCMVIFKTCIRNKLTNKNLQIN